MIDGQKKIVNAIKLCLENMNKKFVDLSRLKFDELNNRLKERFKKQKIQERPFAYEFYHQFRKLWESGFILEVISQDAVIQAEVNKTYQRIPDLEKIPDFLLHKPNTNKNFAVIEFKLTSNIDEIEKDFKKLIAFKYELNYEYLIEIIIGDENSLKNAKERIYSSLNDPNGEKIILIEFNTNSWRANDYEIKYKSTSPDSK